ncbi:MAG: cytochrome c maturation protein CcmE [Sphingomonas bacterium]|nr:cytochrome c maturation protein CcmE [Sphingomonas bacterium]
MSKFRPKHQRLVLALLVIAALVAAALLAMWGLADRAAYFRTPADIVAGKAGEGEAIRLGGMVETGSLRELGGTAVRFTVTDGAAKVPVTYRGILPDLFREGSGMVAEGRMERGIFVADMILAKHDERYMPPQIDNQSAEHQAGKTLSL